MEESECGDGEGDRDSECGDGEGDRDSAGNGDCASDGEADGDSQDREADDVDVVGAETRDMWAAYHHTDGGLYPEDSEDEWGRATFY